MTHSETLAEGRTCPIPFERFTERDRAAGCPPQHGSRSGHAHRHGPSRAPGAAKVRPGSVSRVRSESPVCSVGSTRLSVPRDSLVRAARFLGAQKSGTTLLHRSLEEHPCVLRPATKEAHDFELQSDHGLAWYRANFPTRLVRALARRTGRAPAASGGASPVLPVPSAGAVPRFRDGAARAPDGAAPGSCSARSLALPPRRALRHRGLPDLRRSDCARGGAPHRRRRADDRRRPARGLPSPSPIASRA
jgi:hypothetical protein